MADEGPLDDTELHGDQSRKGQQRLEPLVDDERFQDKELQKDQAPRDRKGPHVRPQMKSAFAHTKAHSAERPGQAEDIEVIGAGFGRTGTLSLKVALEELGYGPCYHMVECLRRPEHKRGWGNAMWSGRTPNLRRLLHGFKATVDWPGCHYYKELMRLYPNAKVILTVRDPEQWWVSANSTIFSKKHELASPPPWHARWLVRPDPMLSGMEEAVLHRLFADKFNDKEFATKVFQDWVDEVQRTVAPERLLVYRVNDGWQPLCSFLGKELPSIPFPHRNTTTEFQHKIASDIFAEDISRRRRLTRLAAVVDLVVGGLLGVAVLCMLMRRGIRCSRFSARVAAGPGDHLAW